MCGGGGAYTLLVYSLYYTHTHLLCVRFDQIKTWRFCGSWYDVWWSASSNIIEINNVSYILYTYIYAQRRYYIIAGERRSQIVHYPCRCLRIGFLSNQLYLLETIKLKTNTYKIYLNVILNRRYSISIITKYLLNFLLLFQFVAKLNYPNIYSSIYLARKFFHLITRTTHSIKFCAFVLLLLPWSLRPAWYCNLAHISHKLKCGFGLSVYIYIFNCCFFKGISLFVNK